MTPLPVPFTTCFKEGKNISYDIVFELTFY